MAADSQVPLHVKPGGGVCLRSQRRPAAISNHQHPHRSSPQSLAPGRACVLVKNECPTRPRLNHVRACVSQAVCPSGWLAAERAACLSVCSFVLPVCLPVCFFKAAQLLVCLSICRCIRPSVFKLFCKCCQQALTNDRNIFFAEIKLMCIASHPSQV